MARLSYQERKKLPSATFVFPGRRAYPIPDKAHARNAKARAAQSGSPEVEAKVDAAVARKFPDIGKPKSKKKPKGGLLGKARGR